MAGRHSTYTEALGKEIADTIACQGKSIKALCKENAHWPSHETIFQWRNNIPSFADLYMKAKKAQVERFIDEIIEISDNTDNDHSVDSSGKTIVNSEAINRSRLRIDTRKWIACKLAPRIYGEKLEHNANISLEEQTQRAKDHADKYEKY